MKHSEKRKLALRIGDKEEIKRYGKGIFDTTDWEERKAKIALRVAKREQVAKKKASKRKERLDNSITS